MPISFRNAGFVNFGSTGVPAVSWFPGTSDWHPGFQAAQRIVKPALEAFLIDAACDISRAAESAYRSVGALSLGSSMLAARTAAGCRGGTPGPTTVSRPAPPFTGGQCVGVNYRVRYRRITPSGAVDQTLLSTPNLAGPIQSVSFANTGSFWTLTIVHGQGLVYFVGNVIQSNLAQGFNIVDVIRPDGLPDNCGNLLMPWALPPADPNPPAAPPVGTQLRPQNFYNIKLGDDNSTQWSVAVGPVIFGGENGFNLDIGSIPVRILPDWSIQLGTGSGSGNPTGGTGSNLTGDPPSLDSGPIVDAIEESTDRLLSQFEDIERDLETIAVEIEGLSPEIAGSVDWVDCDGNEISLPWEGKGLVGLSAQVSTSVAGLMAAPAVSCDECCKEPALGPLSLLLTGVVDEVGYEVRSAVFPEGARRVILSVQAGEQTSIYRLAGTESTGKFGWWGAGPVIDGQVYTQYWDQITRYRSVFPIPGDGWGVRVLLERGVSYDVFIQLLEV